ncbi:MAG TPA: DUF3788 domain-containing protein [Terriglobales bacterium]|nr:DUF3788 domain-containing protein [Terriglobales bacterium]
MDTPNAFVGRKDKPTPTEVTTALGSSAAAWEELTAWLAERHHVDIQEWKSYSPKYGWSAQLKLKKRTILHVSPCSGCFRVMFILGDRAVTAAKNSKLSKKLAELLAKAPRYPEGTGIRLDVKSTKDLAPVRKLAEIKLQN